MRLDIILPTYNRHQLLTRTLDSLLTAEVPADLSVFVTVVDNNSSDATRETVETYQPKFCGRLHYVFEKKQGRSHALNAGINATDGDLVDRKSTRLNSSHLVISYAVFCLKKKKVSKR